MSKNLKTHGGPEPIGNPEIKPQLDGENLINSIISRTQGVIESTPEFLYIISLIERICDPERPPVGVSSTTTISWKAYREAEAFLGDKFIPAIVRYIEGARDERKRVAAYFALRNAIRNVDGADPEAVQYMVNLVDKENKRYALCDLLMNLNQTDNKPQGIDYGPIYRVIETNKFGFGAEAVSALNGAKDPFVEVFLLSILEMSENRDMLIRANAVLSSIGTEKSLPYLEKFTKKRGNIGQSAKFAIGKIRERPKF